MFLHIKRQFSPPVFPDDEIRTRRASLVNAGLLLALTHAVVVLIGIWLGGQTPAIVTVTVAATLGVCLVLYRWLRQGRVEPAGIGILVYGGVCITVISVGLGTAQTPTTAYYVGLVIGAGLLFDLTGIIVTTALSSLAVLGLILAENAGWLPPHNTIGTVTHWVVYTALFGLMGLLTFIALRSERQSLRRAEREIAERERVEKALAREHDLLRTLIDNLPDLIYVKDAESRFLLGNHSIARHMGAAAPEGLLGKTDQDYYPPSLAARFYADEQTLIQTGQALIDHEEPNIDASGNLRWLLTTKLPLRDSQGAIVGLVGIGHDITARRRLEEALRWSEALYHSLVETLPLSIFRKDADGRFTFANTLYCRTQNQSLTDILGKTDYDLHPRDLADKYRADDQRSMTTGEVLKTVEEHQPIAGAKTYVQVVKTPLYDADQHAIGIQGAFWDVTDQIRVEETLRAMNAALERRVAERTHELLDANVRLTELDQLKDEFIGRISHELRTPLTNIKLYLELLKRGKLENHDQYMETLRQQADRLHRLIDDLLDISHLNPDTLDVRHESLDVNALVHDVLADRAEIARERQLTLTWCPCPDLPRLTTDRALLRQVFVHLLANALNYTPRGGAITLRAAPGGTDRAWVTIEVRDTGPGISANDLLHIFEPFYRGKAAADYRTPGAGVGLAIAQRIIGQLGGHIAVDSQPGQGAAFVVWLKTAQT